MQRSLDATIGRILIVLAIVAIIGLVFITLFYALIDNIGNPFGTLNDICVAIGGILSGVLVWRLLPFYHLHARHASRYALASGLIGACLAPIGSALVIFNVTGWFLAGLVTTLGYALIGLWLLGLNVSALHQLSFPRRVAWFGIITGVVMAFGLLAGPGIVARIDSTDSASWFVLLALYLGGLGWNVLYTIWCLWLGRLLLGNKLVLQPATTTG